MGPDVGGVGRLKAPGVGAEGAVGAGAWMLGVGAATGAAVVDGAVVVTGALVATGIAGFVEAGRCVVAGCLATGRVRCGVDLATTRRVTC